MFGVISLFLVSWSSSVVPLGGGPQGINSSEMERWVSNFKGIRENGSVSEIKWLLENQPHWGQEQNVGAGLLSSDPGAHKDTWENMRLLNSSGHPLGLQKKPLTLTHLGGWALTPVFPKVAQAGFISIPEIDLRKLHRHQSHSLLSSHLLICRSVLSFLLWLSL